ncbi:EAL domain-containing protein [Thalassomonas actiniarum]|uniref:EAL domain-containing protein n=1 Tax=Thalassomonas actiniarum TaxID=485447 RepID=A0AAE9YRN6_9GAMM|nr:EAL domain-containing protein [Thalassomonas actiniarum]WDD99029.1 EAL domain-containing protein [Thalassomonas actiniarum]
MRESEEKDDLRALRQLPKLKSLLKKYRHVKNIQSGLLQLSELASTVTEMESFYPSLVSLIRSLLASEHFHICLSDAENRLSLTYAHNPHAPAAKSADLSPDCLSQLVFNQAGPLHVNAGQMEQLKVSGKIQEIDPACIDWLGVPLMRGREVIGVIALQSYQGGSVFAERDNQLLQFISDHLVTAIDRVNRRELLELSIKRRTGKLIQTNLELQREIAERQKAVKMHQALLAMSEITAGTHEIDTFYQLLHSEVKGLINADNLYIALLCEDKVWLNFPYYVDEFKAAPKSRKLAGGLTEMVLNKACPVLISSGQLHALSEQNTQQSEPFAYLGIQGRIPKAWLAAPLMEQGKIFGVLAIQDYHNENAYQESDMELIRFVGQHIATAILRKRDLTKNLEHKAELERLVNDRTQELQASNLNLRMQIEERRKAESQLYYDAHHDALTKLANRAMFSDRLTYAIRHLKRHPAYKFSVLFIDLDRFKLINDTLGHHTGDLFLIEIAARLKECVRENDVLARLGGDEFVVLLDAIQSQDDVEDIATRIIERIAQPFELDGQILHSSASIGISLCHNHYQDANEILRDADAAMYQAKSLGRGRYVFFDESMREQLLASMTLEQELRVAINQQQFELHYQKISNLECSQIIGFEALLRWQHPKKGLLTPSEFLFMAEETGMILEIENWVIEEVSRQLLSWQYGSEFDNAFIAVNLSGRHLTQVSQLSKLIDNIRKNIALPQRLILEFNESAFEQHNEQALKGLRKLKALGVKLALDDYGAGLSSLNFLYSYPFEIIKLDRSFVRSLKNNEKNLSVIRALHELGQDFGYRLVAEGIENEDTLQKLHAAGCEFGQGYYLNRPVKIIRDDPSEDDNKHYA